MFEMPGSPQSIGKVLDTAFRLFTYSFKRVWVLALLAAGAVSVPNFLFSGLASGDPQAIVANFGANMVITFLVVWLVFLAFYNAVFYRMNALSRNADEGAGAALKVGIRKILPVLVAGILFGLAVGIGMILLIIPGLILMVSMILYMPLIVCDDEGPVSALGTSHRLVWGDWWRTTAVFLVPFFIYIIVYMVIAMVAGGVAAMTGGLETGATSPQFNMVFQLIMVVVSVLMYPFFAAVQFAVLNDLKLRKGGVDLEARLEG